MEQQQDCERQRSDQHGSLPLTEPPGESALLPDPQQQGEAASDAVDPSRVWLPELVQHYARSLSCNEVACTLRLVNKAAAAQFSGPQDRTVRLSLPVQRHAFVQRWSGVGATRGLTVKQRRQLSWLTARSGSIANLEVLLAREDCACLGDGVLCAAAGAGQLEVCRWLRQQGCPWDCWALDAAAEGGHQDVCEWLLASGCPWSKEAPAEAARGGHVGLMYWLLGTGHDSPWEGLVEAGAAGCDLPTLQRLHSTHFAQHFDEYSTAPVMAAAAGSLTSDWRAKVEWLEGQGFPRTADACAEAVKQPDWQERLEWLQQRGYPLNGGVAVTAARVGAVDALQYLLESGVALDAGIAKCAAICAADRGHLAVVQALCARGFTIAGAANEAKPGHLPVVIWLAETLGADKVLSAELFASAAESGNMELLAWLHDRGCPWDHGAFAKAADTGCEEQLEWLAARGCPMGEDGQPYMWAVRNGDLATLRCLQRLGCPLGPESGGSVFVRAIEHSRAIRSSSYMLMLQRGLLWLLGLVGAVVDWDEVERALPGMPQQQQREQLLTWVRAQRV